MEQFPVNMSTFADKMDDDDDKLLNSGPVFSQRSDDSDMNNAFSLFATQPLAPTEPSPGGPFAPAVPAAFSAPAPAPLPLDFPAPVAVAGGGASTVSSVPPAVDPVAGVGAAGSPPVLGDPVPVAPVAAPTAAAPNSAAAAPTPVPNPSVPAAAPTPTFVPATNPVEVPDKQHMETARKRVSELSLHLLDGVKSPSELYWHLSPTKNSKGVQVLPCREIHEDAAIGLVVRKKNSDDQILVKYIGHQHDVCATVEWVPRTQLVCFQISSNLVYKEGTHLETFLQQIRSQSRFQNNPVAVLMEQYIIERMVEEAVLREKENKDKKKDEDQVEDGEPQKFSDVALKNKDDTNNENLTPTAASPKKRGGKKRKKETLAAGDLIQYNDPISVADGNNLKTAKIIKINRRDAKFRLELESGDFLPLDHKVKKIIDEEAKEEEQKSSKKKTPAKGSDDAWIPCFQPISEYFCRITATSSKKSPKSGIKAVGSKIKQQISKQQEKIIQGIREKEEENPQFANLAHDLFSSDGEKKSKSGKKKNTPKKKKNTPKKKVAKKKKKVEHSDDEMDEDDDGGSAVLSVSDSEPKGKKTNNTGKSTSAKHSTKNTDKSEKRRTPARSATTDGGPPLKKPPPPEKERVMVKVDHSWEPELQAVIDEAKKKSGQRRAIIHMTVEELELAFKSRKKHEIDVCTLSNRRIPLTCKDDKGNVLPVTVRQYLVRELAFYCKTSDDRIMNFLTGDEKRMLTRTNIEEISEHLKDYLKEPPVVVLAKDERLEKAVEGLEMISSVLPPIWWENRNGNDFEYKSLDDEKDDEQFEAIGEAAMRQVTTTAAMEVDKTSAVAAEVGAAKNKSTKGKRKIEDVSSPAEEGITKKMKGPGE